jgi:hypothetical protein
VLVVVIFFGAHANMLNTISISNRLLIIFYFIKIVKVKQNMVF